MTAKRKTLADEFRARPNGQVEAGGAAPGAKPATPKNAAAVREIPPCHPFPVGSLPAPVAEYVRQAALALGCDPSFVAPHVLAVAASAIGNTRTIRLKGGWEEPCIVWSAVVADSGTLKSPAYRKAVAHLFRVQKHCATSSSGRSPATWKTWKRTRPPSARPKTATAPTPVNRPNRPCCAA